MDFRICKRYLCLFMVVSLLFAKAAQAIVLHTNNEPNMAQWTDRPDPNVVGKWISNVNSTNGRGSCVAVSPKYVVTTRHQGGGLNSKVEIGGVLYDIVEIINHPDEPFGEYKTVDLRVVKLANANLKHYIVLNTSENIVDANLVIGGFGLGRGGELGNALGQIYGYSWRDRDTDKNNYLRWCTNKVDSLNKNFFAQNSSGTIQYNLDVAIADFDGTDPNIDDVNTTEYEGSIAEFDSGGGWFIKEGNQWKLAALCWGSEHAGGRQSWFRKSTNPLVANPDAIYGLLISSYAGWILKNISVEGDFNGDFHVNFIDEARFDQYWGFSHCGFQNGWCDGFDFDYNRAIDWQDLAWITQRWLNDE